MDTKLKNGDFALSSGGVPQWVTGQEAWMQRCALRFHMRRGRFCYDRSMGSALHSLTVKDPVSRWLAAAREALLPEAGISVESAELEKEGCRFLIRTPEGSGDYLFVYGG